MMGNVEIKTAPGKCGRYINVEYFSDGEKLEHFDMKQMICHLLGIAVKFLNVQANQITTIQVIAIVKKHKCVCINLKRSTLSKIT